ncbi:MAG: hypothetical protein MUC59_02265 [Saprospiraceae bacterium]|nr:hypothetical protein [Saprospiraceae bacterium]
MADGEWDQELMAVEENDNIESANQGNRKRKASKDMTSGIAPKKAVESTHRVLPVPVTTVQKDAGTEEPVLPAQVDNVPTLRREQNDDCVLLVRPNDNAAHKMLTSPGKLCTALASPPYSSEVIKDVRVNLRKGLIAIELANSGSVENLISCTKLGPWNVTCSRPNQAKYLYGVVSPVDVEASVETLRECIKIDGTASIVKIERLQKQENQTRIPSTSLRLIFSGDALPSHIKFGPIRYKVRPFVFPPLQCFRCQRLRHTAQGCRSPVRCLICAGPHHVSLCKSTVFKCANCGQAHKANSRDCPRMPARAGFQIGF